MEPLVSELEKLLAGATAAPWEVVDKKPEGAPSWLPEPLFMRAPNEVVHNTRGPDYALEVFSDEHYSAKATDMHLAVFIRNRGAEIVSFLKEPLWKTLDSVPCDGSSVLLRAADWSYPVVRSWDSREEMEVDLKYFPCEGATHWTGVPEWKI